MEWVTLLETFLHTKKKKFWRGEVEWDRNEGKKLRQRVINFVILVDDASVPS